MVTVEDGVFGALADVDAIVTSLDRMDRAPVAMAPVAAVPDDSSFLGDWSI